MNAVEVRIPKMFSKLFPLPEKQNVFIESAPLYARIPQAILADLFQKATVESGQVYVVISRRSAFLRAKLRDWIEATDLDSRYRDFGFRINDTGTTIYVMSPTELNFDKIPFFMINKLVITECSILPMYLYTKLSGMTRSNGQRILIGDFTSKNWFYKQARIPAYSERTSIIQFTAQEIVDSYPDQQELLDELRRKLTVDQQSRFLDLKDIDVERSAPPNYLQWVVEFVPHYCDYEMNAMHKDLDRVFTDMLRDRGRRDVIIGPRGSAKSTHAAECFPLYCICEKLEQYILLISDTSDQANKHLDVIREELSSNEKIAERYPDVFGEGPEWNNNAIETRSGVAVEALGSGKKIRGRRFKNFRPSLIILDDPEGDEAAFSPTIREHRRNWFLKGVTKAGEPKTNILVIGSKIHAECLVAHLAVSPGWREHNYKSIINWPENMDLWSEWENILQDSRFKDPIAEAQKYYESHKEEMLKGSKVLWPERFPLIELMTVRASDGHAAFEQEHQNNPIDPSTCEWNPALFDHPLIWFDEWPKNITMKSIGVDPSKGAQDKAGDYSAIVKIGQHGGFLFVEADLQRRDVQKICEDTIMAFLEFGPDVIGVESDQFQYLIGENMRRIAAERNIMIPIVPVPTEGVNKKVRIRRLSPYVNMKRIRFKRRSPGTQLLIAQMMYFPNADYFDGPDGFEMGCRVMLQYMTMMASHEEARQQDGYSMPLIDGVDN